MEEWRGRGRRVGWIGMLYSYFHTHLIGSRALVEKIPQRLYVAAQRPQRLCVETLTPGEVNFTWRKGGGFRFQFAALWREDPPKTPHPPAYVPRGGPEAVVAYQERFRKRRCGPPLRTPGEVNFTRRKLGGF